MTDTLTSITDKLIARLSEASVVSTLTGGRKDISDVQYQPEVDATRELVTGIAPRTRPYDVDKFGRPGISIGSRIVNTHIYKDKLSREVFKPILTNKVVLPVFVTPLKSHIAEAEYVAIGPYKWNVKQVSGSVSHGEYTFLTETMTPATTATVRVLLPAPNKWDGLYIDGKSRDVFTPYDVRATILVGNTESSTYSSYVQSGKFAVAPGTASTASAKLLHTTITSADSIIESALADAISLLNDSSYAHDLKEAAHQPTFNAVLHDCVTIGLIDSVNIAEDMLMHPWPGARVLTNTLFDGHQPIVSDDPVQPLDARIRAKTNQVLARISDLPTALDQRNDLVTDLRRAKSLQRHTDIKRIFASGQSLVGHIFGALASTITTLTGNRSVIKEIITSMPNGAGWEYKALKDPFEHVGMLQRPAAVLSKTARGAAMQPLTAAISSASEWRSMPITFGYVTKLPGYAINFIFAPYVKIEGQLEYSLSSKRSAPGISVGAAKHITALAAQEKERDGDNSPVTADEFIVASRKLASETETWRKSEAGELFETLIRTFYDKGAFHINPSDPKTKLFLLLPPMLSQAYSDTVLVPVTGIIEGGPDHGQDMISFAESIVRDYIGALSDNDAIVAPTPTVVTFAGSRGYMTLSQVYDYCMKEFALAQTTEQALENSQSGVLAKISKAILQTYAYLYAGAWTTKELKDDIIKPDRISDIIVPYACFNALTSSKDSGFKTGVIDVNRVPLGDPLKLAKKRKDTILDRWKSDAELGYARQQPETDFPDDFPTDYSLT